MRQLNRLLARKLDRDSSGFSLLEIILAIMISSILLIVLEKIYLTIEAAWQLQKKEINHLEQIQLVHDWLSRDIQHAGYLGCLMARKREQISGLDSLLTSTQLQYTDWLSINQNKQELFTQYMSLDSESVTQWLNPWQLLLDNTIRFKSGDKIVIENCDFAVVNTIQKINYRNHNTQQLITLDQPIFMDTSVFDSSAIDLLSNTHIARIIQHRFAIRKTTRKTAAGKPIYSLYLQDQKQRWHELVAGIDQIHFQQIKQAIQVQLFLTNSPEQLVSFSVALNNWV